jgi:hypothetical protein
MPAGARHTVSACREAYEPPAPPNRRFDPPGRFPNIQRGARNTAPLGPSEGRCCFWEVRAGMKRSLAVSGTVILAVLGAVVLSIQPVSGGISGSPPAPPESVIVTGTVQTVPPDGGLRVTLGSDTVPVTGTVGANVIGTVPVSGNVAATVSGSVTALPPDGGMRVTLGSDTVPVTGTVGANIIGTVPVSGSVSANVVGTVPVSGSVQAYPPDGGAEVRVTNRVGIEGVVDTNISGQSAPIDSNITNAYLSVGTGVGAPKISAEVTGLAGAAVTTTVSGSVLVSGYSSVPTVALQNGTQVALTSSSLASIAASTAERVCTYGTPVVTAALGTTAAAQPSSAMTGRTEVLFKNLTANDEAWCRINGTPSSTNAIVLIGVDAVTLLVRDTDVLNCRCDTGTCRVSVQEASCTQPAP